MSNVNSPNEIIRSLNAHPANGGCLPVIDIDQLRSRQGLGYMFIADVAIVDTDVAYRLFRVGSKRIYWKQASIVSELSNFRLEIYEGPTVTDTGTEVNNVIAFNRAIECDDCDITIYRSPTVTDEGFLIDLYWIPGEDGIGGRSVGDKDNTGIHEFALKTNTDYLIKGYRTEGTGTNRVTVKYKWTLQ